MWTKYDYLCTDCDALIEITTLQTIPKCFEPECACGSANIINIGVTDATVYEGDSLKQYVTSITPPELVKINSNPYN
jgi:hypothetical protein